MRWVAVPAFRSVVSQVAGHLSSLVSVYVTIGCDLFLPAVVSCEVIRVVGLPWSVVTTGRWDAAVEQRNQNIPNAPPLIPPPLDGYIPYPPPSALVIIDNEQQAPAPHQSVQTLAEIFCEPSCIRVAASLIAARAKASSNQRRASFGNRGAENCLSSHLFPIRPDRQPVC